ncbi:MAG: hypothetical protein EOM72_06080 [Opitutae bacterium]|nr:hypothetical protein [Opitutae bacterium]
MASQGKLIGIVAWSLVVVLLIGVGALAFLNRQQAGQAAGLADALLKAGAVAGVEGLAPETLKDAAKVPEVLQQVETAIQGARLELASTKDALAAAQAEATDAKTELSQRVQEQTAKMDALAKELATKDEAVAAAKIEMEQAGQEAQDARKAAEKQKAELEASMESLKAKMAEESARLQAELDAARQQILAAEAAPVGEETAGEEPAAAAPEGSVAEESSAEAAPEPEGEEESGRIIGQSEMFSLIRYSEKDQTLFFRLLDGQTLTYQGVSMDAYDRLVGAGDTLDVNFRFKIQGVYKSIPSDSVVVRKYWKWSRRNPGRADVRVIEPAAAPAGEAEAAPEAAPEEAPAEE